MHLIHTTLNFDREHAAVQNITELFERANPGRILGRILTLLSGSARRQGAGLGIEYCGKKHRHPGKKLF
jgi:hypothetical protein